MPIENKNILKVYNLGSIPLNDKDTLINILPLFVSASKEDSMSLDTVELETHLGVVFFISFSGKENKECYAIRFGFLDKEKDMVSEKDVNRHIDLILNGLLQASDSFFAASGESPESFFRDFRDGQKLSLYAANLENIEKTLGFYNANYDLFKDILLAAVEESQLSEVNNLTVFNNKRMVEMEPEETELAFLTKIMLVALDTLIGMKTQITN